MQVHPKAVVLTCLYRFRRDADSLIAIYGDLTYGGQKSMIECSLSFFPGQAGPGYENLAVTALKALVLRSNTLDEADVDLNFQGRSSTTSSLPTMAMPSRTSNQLFHSRRLIKTSRPQWCWKHCRRSRMKRRHWQNGIFSTAACSRLKLAFL